MTGGGRQGRTENVFLQAVEVPPERRSAFLAEACGGDAELRKEVESLLRHHQPASNSEIGRASCRERV